jgi:hypothetical protein
MSYSPDAMDKKRHSIPLMTTKQLVFRVDGPSSWWAFYNAIQFKSGKLIESCNPLPHRGEEKQEGKY